MVYLVSFVFLFFLIGVIAYISLTSENRNLDPTTNSSGDSPESVDIQCKNDPDTERKWEEDQYRRIETVKSMKVSESICVPKPQYIYGYKDENFSETGIIVNRCPGGCGTCENASHRCRSAINKTVIAIAQFVDSDGDVCYKKVQVWEDTDCKCEYIRDAVVCPQENITITPW